MQGLQQMRGLKGFARFQDLTVAQELSMILPASPDTLLRRYLQERPVLIA